ncbi:hypothetical protein AS859_03575 [Aliarcobacter cryaerophilus]|uniref:GTP cyclohydrolase I domain-containing protein n=1 Tax=Aliarcobacter cryaerophilus TaxID=28198 RepID=A0A1V9VCW1_9BACT|nr:hypothetical protein AS859_03575 [Aliarcobacter cryaerophilus]
MNENLKEITKNTLEKLRQKNLPTTPENYFLEFKEQAKIFNTEYSDVNILNEALKNLTNDEKKVLSSESIFEIILILSKRANNDELKSLIGTFSDLAVVKDIEFYSFCEHHMLPIIGIKLI